MVALVRTRDGRAFSIRFRRLTASHDSDRARQAFGAGTTCPGSSYDLRFHRALHRTATILEPVVSRNSNEAIGQCASRLLDDPRRLVSPYTPLRFWCICGQQSVCGPQTPLGSVSSVIGNGLKLKHMCFAVCRFSTRERAFSGPKSPDAPELDRVDRSYDLVP
jgi:hypothetical protein